jgi:hypothetical protein
MRPLSERVFEAAHGPAANYEGLTDLLEEAAAILKRYEDAPVGFVMGQGLLTGGAAAIVQMERPEDVKGQRVRILLDTEGA